MGRCNMEELAIVGFAAVLFALVTPAIDWLFGE
jgi:hypothetical protein